MNLNDLALTEHLVKIHEHVKWLDHLAREGKEHQLFLACMQIETHAREAQWRLNDLKRKK